MAGVLLSFRLSSPVQSSVSHLLARWASVDGEETLLKMLHDCVLEWGMAEGGAVEVEGRVNASSRTEMWLKGAVVDVGLNAASVDVLCMVLDPDCDKAVSTNQLQHWRKGLLATAQHKSGKTTPPALVLRRQDQGLSPHAPATAEPPPPPPPAPAPPPLLAACSSRTKVSRLSSILPRVADLIIREAPEKLNPRFEELAGAMLRQSSAESGPPRTMAKLVSAQKEVS